ncbi:MAG: HD domain-containing protein [Bacteroidales bacterium]
MRIDRQKAIQLIDKYFPKSHPARDYYMVHVEAVAHAARLILTHNAHLNLDPDKIEAMALLHDIGIVKVHAPEIGCNGEFPYICHGYLGREILEKEGLFEIAPICERHTGVGITIQDIDNQKLPLPRRDMIPLTAEERLICYADKFFSKSAQQPDQPKPLEKILKSLAKYGPDKPEKFMELAREFGYDYIYENFPSYRQK